MSYTETDRIVERAEFNEARNNARFMIKAVLDEAIDSDTGIYLPNYDDVENEVALMLM